MSGLSLFGSGLTITEAQGPTYYLGTWNASTNTPTLASSTAPAGPGGSYYIVSVAGTTNLNGITDWTVGDWVIWSGSVWQKLEGGMTSVTVGSTQIAGGTTGRVLYDNAGVLGEMTNTGTGTVNVLQTSPALITPALGVATATSLALGGATIGANALAVTGTSAFGSNISVDGSYTLGAGGIRGSFGAPSDGVFLMRDSSAANFNRLQFGGQTSSFPAIKRNATALNFRLADDSADAPITAAAGTFSGTLTTSTINGGSSIRAYTSAAPPAGGTTSAGYLISSTTNFGIFFGSGAPTLSAAKGSLYLRSDGTGVADRMYVNTDGSTTWTAVATVG